MSHLSRLTAIGLVVALLTGCAIIMHGTKQQIAVNSNPSGAKVLVMGVEQATTPAVIKLDRGDSIIILRFEKDGYQSVDIALTRSVSGWIAGNIIFGGVIGLVVDFASGAAYKIAPESVTANLQAVHSGNQDPNNSQALLLIEIKEE